MNLRNSIHKTAVEVDFERVPVGKECLPVALVCMHHLQMLHVQGSADGGCLKKVQENLRIFKIPNFTLFSIRYC
jgi:hypothetical protein